MGELRADSRKDWMEGVVTIVEETRTKISRDRKYYCTSAQTIIPLSPSHASLDIYQPRRGVLEAVNNLPLRSN